MADVLGGSDSYMPSLASDALKYGGNIDVIRHLIRFLLLVKL